MLCLELPITKYETVYQLQLMLVTSRIEGLLTEDVLILCEHNPVFTLGKNRNKNNLKVTEKYLNKLDIAVLPVERGGDITYHGPGQLVGYPILNLKHAGLGVREYVELLETLMIRTARDCGVSATTNPLNHGVWVENRKLGSIGISVGRSISFHGFALNVELSLDPFEWINPCGLQGVSMTTLGRETSKLVAMMHARECVKLHLMELMKVNLEPVSLAALNDWIQRGKG